MANDWKRQEVSKQFASKGLARIRTGEQNAKITFLSKDKKGNEIVWDNGEVSKTFHREDLPDNFVFEPKTESEYFVCTSFDKSEVFSIGPWEGTFEMRPYDISRDKDTKEPAPFASNFKDKKTGKDISQLRFKILWKITEPGEFKGQLVSQMQVYQAERSGVQDDGNGYAMWRGSTDSDLAVWQPRLEKTFERLHVSDSMIPWPKDGNILPEVWERIESSPEQKFRMVVEKGEVVGFADTKGKRKIEEEIDEVDETLASKKRSVAELKAELAGEPKSSLEVAKMPVDDVDEEFPPVEKKAKKAAKKVVEEEDEEEL